MHIILQYNNYILNHDYDVWLVQKINYIQLISFSDSAVGIVRHG